MIGFQPKEKFNEKCNKGIIKNKALGKRIDWNRQKKEKKKPTKFCAKKENV